MRKAQEQLKNLYVTSLSEIEVNQDEDVLDTWFSSGLLPLSVKTDQISHQDTYTRLSLMETGCDILFFWVARMVMLCSSLKEGEGKSPFPLILLHGIIRDSQGRKMSKSLGNVIDPLSIIEGCSRDQLVSYLTKQNGDHLSSIELLRGQSLIQKQFPHGIPTCGSDALRMGLLSLAFTSTHILSFNLQDIIKMKHFCDKIWNASKFILMHLKDDHSLSTVSLISDQLKTTEFAWLVNRWMLHRYFLHLKIVNTSLETYQLGHAIDEIQRFFIKEFCDIYLESCKFQFSSKERNAISHEMETKHLLNFMWLSLLSELHPFAPYLTEVLYRFVKPTPEETSLMETNFPNSETFKDFYSSQSELEISWILDVVRHIRSFRQKQKLPSSSHLKILISDETMFNRILDFKPFISFLTRSFDLSIVMQPIIKDSPLHDKNISASSPSVSITCCT